jgi:hypothetical protein
MRLAFEAWRGFEVADDMDIQTSVAWENWKVAWKAGRDKAILEDERAIRIAKLFAEDWLRAEGEPTNSPDEYTIPDVLLSELMNDCIEHLCWHGQAVRHHCDDGYTVVQFGDFTLSGDEDVCSTT